jgi:hypothetical protein
MPKKIAECTKAHLVSVPLPNHGASYTVISHQSVMDYVYTELATAGFSVISEEYRCTADGQIAHGIYKLNFNSDPELSMMFAWTNSYNKQVRFKCGVGGYINLTGTTMVCGDMGSWARKHTGTADEETIKTIQDQIANAHMYYNQLCSDKEAMKGITLNKRKQAQLLGILFAEYQILTTEQASIVRQQMERPSHVYTDSNSLWAFYNFVTIALQHSHPKTWMEDQRVLHYFISTVNNFQQCSAPAQIVVPVPTDINANTPVVNPNQVDLLDLIAIAEAEQANRADLEADQMDEDVRYAAQEEVIIYTDPVGNTFEAINFHNEVVSDTNQLEDPEDEEDLNDWMNLPIEAAPEDDVPPYEPAEDQEYTGENASYMKGSDFDIDKSNEELFAEEKGTPSIFDIAATLVKPDNFGLDFTDDTNEDTDKVPDFF